MLTWKVEVIFTTLILISRFKMVNSLKNNLINTEKELTSSRLSIPFDRRVHSIFCSVKENMLSWSYYVHQGYFGKITAYSYIDKSGVVKLSEHEILGELYYEVNKFGDKVVEVDGEQECMLRRIDVYNNRDRRQGVGTEMMRQMEEQLSLHGCTGVHFEAVPEAIPFYDKLGAVEISKFRSRIKSATAPNITMYLKFKSLNNHNETEFSSKVFKQGASTEAFLNTYV